MKKIKVSIVEKNASNRLITAKASKDQTLEDLFLSEIKRLQSKLKPGVFRKKKNQ